MKNTRIINFQTFVYYLETPIELFLGYYKASPKYGGLNIANFCAITAKIHQKTPNYLRITSSWRIKGDSNVASQKCLQKSRKTKKTTTNYLNLKLKLRVFYKLKNSEKHLS